MLRRMLGPKTKVVVYREYRKLHKRSFTICSIYHTSLRRSNQGDLGMVGHAAFMGEIGTVYRILIRKPDLKRPPETSRRE